MLDHGSYYRTIIVLVCTKFSIDLAVSIRIEPDSTGSGMNSEKFCEPERCILTKSAVHTAPRNILVHRCRTWGAFGRAPRPAR